MNKSATTDRGQVFWNWEMVLACNYRCSYCNYTCLGWERHHVMNAFPGLKRLSEVWARLYELYGSIHIELSGGECTTYPAFHGVLNMLTGLHSLSIDTNLSFDPELLVKWSNPDRLRISSSFHPQFADFDEFLKKCLYLKEKKVGDIFVNFVAYPDQLDQAKHVKSTLNRYGIACYLQPFQGVYKKKLVYPGAYTSDEMKIIEEALSGGGMDSEISRGRFDWRGHAMRSGTDNQVKKINEERAGRGQAPLADPAGPPNGNGEAPLSPKPKKTPVLCHQGQKYAKTYVNGDTYRCCAKISEERPAELLSRNIYLGNLFFDGQIKLLDEPALCDYDPCPCDRCMVVGEEDRWEDRWSAPHVPGKSGPDGGVDLFKELASS